MVDITIIMDDIKDVNTAMDTVLGLFEKYPAKDIDKLKELQCKEVTKDTVREAVALLEDEEVDVKAYDYGNLYDFQLATAIMDEWIPIDDKTSVDGYITRVGIRGFHYLPDQHGKPDEIKNSEFVQSEIRKLIDRIGIHEDYFEIDTYETDIENEYEVLVAIDWWFDGEYTGDDEEHALDKAIDIAASKIEPYINCNVVVINTEIEPICG